MVRSEVIRKRLNKIDDCSTVLQRIQRYGRDEFLSDPERCGSAERFLHPAIEALLDMGNHITARPPAWLSPFPNHRRLFRPNAKRAYPWPGGGVMV
jgi:hypothetical protein